MDRIIYSVVVPVYNEQEVIAESYRRLKETMEKCGERYELIFVNDGSRDETLKKLREIADRDQSVKFLSFSRNFGHQTAITAGMEASSGDAVLVIDADLQDPPEVMLKMMEKWKDGYDVVYGKRLKRKGETFFKKLTARVFYRFLSAMTEIDIPVDTGDFRLISRKVCQVLMSLPEHNRYVRGLVSWVGFSQTAVEYVREERFAGETKYPLKKMLKFAGDGIAAFSYKPLKLSAWLGAAVGAGGLALSLAAAICAIVKPGLDWTGWAALGGVILMANAAVLIALSIIGQYIGRVCDEARGRPLYIVAEKAGFDEKD